MNQLKILSITLIKMKMYLQQEYNDGNFSGDIETKTIKDYKLYYENDQSDEE